MNKSLKRWPQKEPKMTLLFHGITPQELTEQEFVCLKSGGMLWELFPDAPEFFCPDLYDEY